MTAAKKNGAKHTTETVEAAVKAGADAFAKGYEQVTEATKEQFEKANEFTFKNYDEITDFNKGTLEAVVVSGNVLAKGAEIVGKELVDYTQKSVEKNFAAAQKMFAAKNVQEAIDLQAAWAKDAFDAFWAESAKLQDMSMKVTNEASAPINERINAAVEKFSKPIAA